MIKNVKKLLFISLFILLMFPSFASINKIEMRNILSNYLNTHAKEKKTLKPKEIGEWYNIIENTLFSLIRRTELYRGHLNLTIYDENEASCKMHPDSSIFINTALLEYIDETLFLSSAGNIRKIKNINIEKERYLAAFLAFEVARFALDIDVLNFISDSSKIRNLSKQNIFLVDEMASILLKVAGYDSTIMIDHLERLKKAKDENLFSFNDDSMQYLNERILKLEEEKETIEKTSEEILNIIFQLNTQKGIMESLQSLELLKASYPSSLYFLRLEAITTHSIYLEQIPNLTPSFIPFLPVAVIGYSYAEKYYITLENKLNASPFISNAQNEEYEKTTNLKFLKNAILLYKEYINTIEDANMKAAYFTLLSISEDEKIKNASLENVNTLINNSESIIEKLNYAISLLNLNEDRKKVNDIFEKAINIINKKTTNEILNSHMFFDERLIFYNYALSLSKDKKQNKKKILSILNILKSKLYAKDENKALIIRGLEIGNTTDEMTKIWGEPSSIVYNYYFERWVYNRLKAIAVISSYSTPPSVMQIILNPHSTVSLKEEIRVGDDRKTFEKEFGKSIYKAGDCEVYFYDNKALHVLYSSSEIVKSISIFQAFKAPL